MSTSFFPSEKDKTLSRREFARFSLVAGALLVVPATFQSAAYASEETLFIDDAERRTYIKIAPEKLVPSGRYAESILLTLCPEKLASTADESVSQNSRSPLYSLPSTGQLFIPESNDSGIDVEAIEIACPDLIIDAGDFKTNLEPELNNLEAQSNTPTLYVDATFGNLAAAYRTLGALLNCEQRAESLAAYIEQVNEYVSAKSSLTPPISVLFCEGETGLSVRGRDSYQAKAIEALGMQSAAIYKAEANSIEIDLADVAEWNPDAIIFSSKNCFDRICERESPFNTWQIAPAVREGRFFQVPEKEYSWFGSPPLFTQSIGLLWLGNLLFPETYDLDIAEEAQSFYKLFLNTELTDNEVASLLDCVPADSAMLAALAEENPTGEADPIMESRVIAVIIDKNGYVLRQEIREGSQAGE